MLRLKRDNRSRNNSSQSFTPSSSHKRFSRFACEHTEVQTYEVIYNQLQGDTAKNTAQHTDSRKRRRMHLCSASSPPFALYITSHDMYHIHPSHRSFCERRFAHGGGGGQRLPGNIDDGDPCGGGTGDTRASKGWEVQGNFKCALALALQQHKYNFFLYSVRHVGRTGPGFRSVTLVLQLCVAVSFATG